MRFEILPWLVFNVLLTGGSRFNSLTITSILRLQYLVILTKGHNPTSKQNTPIPTPFAGDRG